MLKDCPGTACPPFPLAFVPCDTPMTCTYYGGCGPVKSTCSGGSWRTTLGACSSGGSCPATEPAVGDPCLASGKCSYTNECGNETAYCDSSGFTLGIDYAHCPGCPTTQPKNGTECSGASRCWYANACGRRNESRCVGAVWTTTEAPCTK